jgi:signal recognition particle receptor subunit beta
LTGRRPHRPGSPDKRVAILVAGAPGAGKRTFQQSDPDLPLAVRDLTAGTGHEPGTSSEAIRLDLVTVSDAGAIRPSAQLGAPVVGAVVVVDTARLAGCFAMVDDLEALGVPFVVAVNPLPGREHRHPEEVRAALSLPAEVPVVICDCRDRRAVHRALVAVTRRALEAAPAS